MEVLVIIGYWMRWRSLSRLLQKATVKRVSVPSEERPVTSEQLAGRSSTF